MLITPHLPAILEAVSQHPVVSVEAPTGTGKSLCIPASLAHVNLRTWVTVPTRTAAVSLCQYQRNLTSASVGYAAEGQISYKADTDIVYVTTGHARRKILRLFSQGESADWNFCNVLMVDEVHSGSLDNTMILSLWMTAAMNGVSVPRLLIASATPIPMPLRIEPFVYKVELEQYTIDYTYETTPYNSREKMPDLCRRTARTVANLHDDSDISEGHILVFAPGANDVDDICTELTDLCSSSKISPVILPAYSSLSTEEISRIYAPCPNTRKIIVATNLAEMSITVPDVGHVVDMMLEKRAETSKSGGFRLITHLISQDSARQRAGRTGRTCNGRCHRMMTQEQYSKLEKHRPLEIERIPLHDALMELFDVGLTPETVLHGMASHRVIPAIHLLTKLDMIRINQGLVTVNPSGHFAPNFPLSVRNANFLWRWLQAGHPPFPGIVIASLIDCYGPSYFWLPRRKQNESPIDYQYRMREYKDEHFPQFTGHDDLETSLNLWHVLVKFLGGLRPQSHKIGRWVKQHSIHGKKIRELLTIVQQCVHAAQRLHYDVTIGPFTTRGAMMAALPILKDVYEDLTLSLAGLDSYSSNRSKILYKLDTRDNISSLCDNLPQDILALITAEIATPHNSMHVVSFAVKLDSPAQHDKYSRGAPITRV